jgi:hypothetical protein
MEIHKPRETSGREEGKRKGKNRNEEQIDDARRNKNHSRKLERQIRKLKKRKAPERNGVPNVWDRRNTRETG